MTGPRLPHGRPTPSLTGGDDRPEPACAGNPWPYDALIDRPGDAYAVEAAREMCNRCPIAATCLDTNRGETWAQAVLGLPIRQENDPSPASKAATSVHAERRVARLNQLHKLLERGADADEAVTLLNTTREGLYKWCHRWGHLDLWARLSPPRVAPCGTPAGEKRHHAQGEKPCADCREAARVALKEFRAKRRDAA